MLRTYFRIAWRHLGKNKGYTAINIIGLATGMAIALVIGLWITDELTFDHYHTNHSRIAQAMITQSTPEHSYTGRTVAMPLGQVFRTRYRDLFSSIALAHDGSNHLISAGDKKLTVKNDHQPATFTMLNFRVDDIDQAVDDLTQRG